MSPIAITYDEAVEAANKIIENWDALWPLDDWISLADNWDLNLLLVGTDHRAFLYPVVNNETDTSKEYPVVIP